MSGGYRYLFGPVRSRRLGRSLGIDLVPLKVCTYDCPYCQVGATTEKTLSRREYVPVTDVLAEFDHWLAHDGQADCITLAGGGEPTLHLRFGDVIDGIGVRCQLRRILLSNGSLFSLPAIREAAAKAEVVKATLSAWDQASFEQAHRPHPDLRFPLFLDGLRTFRAEFRGEYWLEVFAVPGLNDTPAHMERIAALARLIAPDRIHLNTAVRPARDGAILPVATERLEEFAGLFSPVAEVVGVKPASGAALAPGDTPPAALSDRLQALIQRHPCTSADMAAMVNRPVAEVERALAALVAQDVLHIERRGELDYFVMK